MKTIGIILGDNDFCNTFPPLLAAIHAALLYNPEVSYEEVREMIYKGVPFFYYTYQGKEQCSTALEYLKKIEVMFDDELRQFISQNDHDGGSWYLDVRSGTVISF